MSKVVRDSSLELYRIIVMLAIVAHHYVVNSGLMASISGGGGMTCNKLFLLCFGAWGKIGINCFMLITGYFMCTSQITLRKFLKLYFELAFYSIVLNAVFVISGCASLDWRTVLYSVFPVSGITSDRFFGAFFVFYLTIPFLNILVAHINQRQHFLLLALLIPVFTILPFFPGIAFAYNHVEWFAILYFISSYLRKYPNRLTENRRLWACLSVLALICGIASVVLLSTSTFNLHLGPFYFVADSNKFSALAASLCFFLAFKPSQKTDIKSTVNLNLQPQPSFYSPLINTIASATFGVLCIHANSRAMIRWLWCDVCDVAGNYERCTQLSTSASDLSLSLVLHAIGCVLVIFIVCAIIDLLRQRFIECPLLGMLFPDEK